jgi:hypothetical protein
MTAMARWNTHVAIAMLAVAAACDRDPVRVQTGTGGGNASGVAGVGGIGIGAAGMGAGAAGVTGGAGTGLGTGGTSARDASPDTPTGECALLPAGATCRPGTCADNTVVGEHVCDDNGECRPSPTIVCAPYACSSQTNRCIDRCTSDADCVAGRVCEDSACRSPRPGQCTDGNQCASGFCVEGVCCDSACTGACRTCANRARPGVCMLVPAGTQDPRGMCQRQGGCGRLGSCDGSGACALAPTGTICSPASCVGSTFTPAGTCNGMGTCVTPAPVSCLPLMCNASGTCGGCLSDVACAVRYYCASDGACRPQVVAGAPCTRNGECSTGLCVDGVCCTTNCTGPCVSCRLPGREGTCALVPGGERDPHGICADLGPGSCTTTGACDGRGACARYPAGTPCGITSCHSSTVLATGALCDGAGLCRPPTLYNCSPFTCDPGANQCRSRCSAPSDCSPGFSCQPDGRCAPGPTP